MKGRHITNIHVTYAETNKYEMKHPLRGHVTRIGQVLIVSREIRKRDTSRMREMRSRCHVCAMNVDIEVAFRAAVAESAANEVARIAEKLRGRIGRIGDQRERVVGVRGVGEGSACTETVFVQEVVALPAGVDVAGAR